MISSTRMAMVAAMAVTSCAAGATRPHGGEEAAAAAVVIPASKMSWSTQTPGLPMQLAVLWGNRDTGPFGQLIKLPGGFDSGLHAHTGNYHGVLVAGTWIHIDGNGAGKDVELTPGSYVLQPGKGMHIDKCKAGAECVLFIYQNEKADVIWPAGH